MNVNRGKINGIDSLAQRAPMFLANVLNAEPTIQGAKREKGVVAHLTERMNAWIAKRERETGAPNPMFTNLNWHGSKTHAGPFTSSQQAYDTMHIGSVGSANKLQAGNKKKKK